MSVARMREAIFGVGITFFPGYRFSHPGYDVLVIASWDRWIRHRPALDESLRLDVGSMTPFLSDFLPRSEATIAVGTLIAERPPHRTVRAAFPHTAPTLGG